jgi:hypothetical protein
MPGSEQAQGKPESFLAGAPDDRDIHGPEAYGNPRSRALLGSAAVETAIWGIELGVGVACLAIAVLAVRNHRLRVAGVVLSIAGLAAVAHAVFQLVTN